MPSPPSNGEQGTSTPPAKKGWFSSYVFRIIFFLVLINYGSRVFTGNKSSENGEVYETTVSSVSNSEIRKSGNYSSVLNRRLNNYFFTEADYLLPYLGMRTTTGVARRRQDSGLLYVAVTLRENPSTSGSEPNVHYPVLGSAEAVHDKGVYNTKIILQNEGEKVTANGCEEQVAATVDSDTGLLTPVIDSSVFENPIHFADEEPYRTVTKNVNLTRCLHLNCSLTAVVQVWYRNERTTASGKTRLGPVHSLIFEQPLISWADVVEESHVHLLERHGKTNNKSVAVVKQRTVRTEKGLIDDFFDRMVVQRVKQLFVQQRHLLLRNINSTNTSKKGLHHLKTTKVMRFQPILTVSPLVHTTGYDIRKSVVTRRVEDEPLSNDGDDMDKYIFRDEFSHDAHQPSGIPGPMLALLRPVRHPRLSAAERRSLERAYGSRKKSRCSDVSSDCLKYDEDIDFYAPMIYLNNFWLTEDQLIDLSNETCGSTNFTLAIHPVSLMKYMMYNNFEQSMNRQIRLGFMGSKDKDETKNMLIRTNPWLLGTTCVVSILHVVFEGLAMKNDVSFWRSRGGVKDDGFKGLSLRTVALNCYFQLMIFLYLLDNSATTSIVVLLPTFGGVLIEFWKLRKVMWFESIEKSKNEPALPLRLLFFWKHYRLAFHHSYSGKAVKYDQQAMKYLGCLLGPLLVAYSGYSLLYDHHKSWYSFFIKTQVQFIYFFNFLALTPQLFINYELKSVPAMPWRTFVYKFLNTIIDDLFSFIIVMPTLHRISCFKDDVVFVILLYQKWIYKVDTTRTDESIPCEVDNNQIAEEKKKTD